MKRRSVNKLIVSFLLFILFIPIGIVGVAFAFFDVNSSWNEQIISWQVVPLNGESFRDFHVMTSDEDPSKYMNPVNPVGWNFGIIDDGIDSKWISFWGDTPQTTSFTFSVKYIGVLPVVPSGNWLITEDGNSIIWDYWIDRGSGAHAPGTHGNNGRAPTLNQWVLIILALSVGGFLVWQLKRRKAVVSLR